MSITLHSCIHYGYLLLSDEMEEFIALNQYLPEPFYIACLLPEMSLDVTSLEDIPVRHVIFGIPVNAETDIEQLLVWRVQLDEFLTTGMLEGFQFASQPRFYSGIPWMPSDSDSDSETTTDEDEEEEEEEDEDDEDEDEDEEEEEEEDDDEDEEEEEEEEEEDEDEDEGEQSL